MRIKRLSLTLIRVRHTLIEDEHILNYNDYQKAIADFNQAIKLKPDDSIAYNNRGVSKYNLGDNKGAIALFCAEGLDREEFRVVN